jgi:hypothetical protein
MDAYDMVARCARQQNPIGRISRYEVRTGFNDKCGARYVDLPSALVMGKLLVEIGYPTVLVLDTMAPPGQPQIWIWEARAGGVGAWSARGRKPESAGQSGATRDAA